MESLLTAANIRAGNDVRDEAIAILGVSDLRPAETWASDAGLKDLGAMAPDFSCFATTQPDGTVNLFALPGGNLVATRPRCLPLALSALTISRMKSRCSVVDGGASDMPRHFIRDEPL